MSLAVAAFAFNVMNCQHPITIKNPSLLKFERDFYKMHGRDPTFAESNVYLERMCMKRTMEVPCGKCLYCYKNRADEWRTRLQQEHKFSFCSFFVTLTYSPEFEPKDLNVSKPDVQKFFKRFRHNMSIPLRYFLVSEYTPTGTLRPHYHFAVFFESFVSLDEVDVECRKAWPLGFVTVGELTDGRISYMSTYCIKYFNKPPEGRAENFMLCSRRPFIGSGFMTPEMKDFLHYTVRSYIVVNGYKHKLPRIYRDKIFDDSEKVDLRLKAQEVVRKRKVDLEKRILFFADKFTYERAKLHIAQLDFKDAYRKYRESKKF